MPSSNLKLLGIGHETGQTQGGKGWEPELRLAVGESQRVRKVQLTERDLLHLIEGAMRELDRLRLEREKGVR